MVDILTPTSAGKAAALLGAKDPAAALDAHAAAAPRTMLIDIKRCKAELKTAFPQVAWVFFEPALDDDVASSQECRTIDA